VGPVAWEPADESHWHIDMRCGECGHRWERIVDQQRATRFDAELNGDIALLRRTLTRLDLERMAVDAETFAVALERDLIEPADFVL
jgi:hypothetical protein